MLRWPVCQRCQHCSRRQHSAPRRPLRPWPPCSTAAAAALAAAARALQRCNCAKWSWARCRACPSGARPFEHLFTLVNCRSPCTIGALSLHLSQAEAWAHFRHTGSSCASRPALYLCDVDMRVLPRMSIRRGPVHVYGTLVGCSAPCAIDALDLHPCRTEVRARFSHACSSCASLRARHPCGDELGALLHLSTRRALPMLSTSHLAVAECKVLSCWRRTCAKWMSVSATCARAQEDACLE